jgi:RNA polymerase-binding protein DksA
MKNYEAISKVLKEKLVELEHRAGRIDRDVRHAGAPLPADSVEQISERANEEVLDGLNESARIEMEQINAALARMDRGDYGVCKECGEEIGLKRLEAVPYAECCINCAE